MAVVPDTAISPTSACQRRDFSPVPRLFGVYRCASNLSLDIGMTREDGWSRSPGRQRDDRGENKNSINLLHENPSFDLVG